MKEQQKTIWNLSLGIILASLTFLACSKEKSITPSLSIKKEISEASKSNFGQLLSVSRRVMSEKDEVVIKKVDNDYTFIVKRIKTNSN